MKTTVPYDADLKRHLDAVLLEATSAAGCYVADLFSARKSAAIVAAREAVADMLLTSVMIADIGGGQIVVRLLNPDGREYYRSPGADPGTAWEPIAAAQIGSLLNLDHSTIVRELARRAARRSIHV